MSQESSSSYSNIDHPIDRSLLGTCAITLLFLLVSLTLFGPFIALLVPALIIASLTRFAISIIFCDSCQPGRQTESSEFFSPDRLLIAEETRWLKSKSKVLILMVLDGGMEIDKLRSLILTRLVKARKEEPLLSPDSGPSLSSSRPQSFTNLNQLMYPKFSQRISKSKSGWTWKFDRDFEIDNHVCQWNEFVPKSVLSCGEELSDLISQVNKAPLNSDRAPWDSYLISVSENSTKRDLNIEFNNINKHQQENNLLLFRLHPSLADGISLVHILCSSLCDEQCPVELKDRFHSSGNFLNSIRALFIGPVVFIQKWLLTRRDCNIFHPFPDVRKCNSKSVSNNSLAKVSCDAFGTKESNPGDGEGDRLFHFCTYSLSSVARIKGVTRSTFTEIFLAAVAGALRTYQQRVCKVQHPFDVLCLLPTDHSKERHGASMPGRNSSSVASKTSNQSSMVDLTQHIRNNYSLVDFGLPTNTEGMIPRLWEVKQRMEELKNSADSVILGGLTRILKHVFPDCIGRRVMGSYYNKNSLSISSLQGPDSALTVGGRRIHQIIYWFPSLCDVTLSISCFSYGDLFTCSVSGDNDHLPRIELILDAVVYQMELLNKLLENRRIPGEHKSQRYPALAGDEPKTPLNVGKLDACERELIKQSLSPSISSEHLYTRLSSIQNQLQNDKDLTDDELDALRAEFSSLMGILRRRKSCGIDTNGEMADFDEEIEEMSNSQTGSRRPSLPGLMVLSTRRRSLATSLTRPLSTGNRSRSNSKAALQSSNYLVSPSCSSSKRPSLRYNDDLESGPEHFSTKIESRFTKHEKTRPILEVDIDSSSRPRSISRGNESTPSTAALSASGRSGAERSVPRRCREDRV